MESSDLVRSYLRLTLADGVGAVTFGRLIEAFGDAKSVIEAGPARWKQVDGVGPKKVSAITEVGDDLVDQSWTKRTGGASRSSAWKMKRIQPA